MLSINYLYGSDYYPFGMGMPGRVLYADNYNYGFGSHEILKEVTGTGNRVDLGDRWLDVRLGISNKPDFKASKFPDTSPYSYSSNSPILFIDPDGMEVKAYSSASQALVLRTLNYAFGNQHGFSFVNNVLIHSGVLPKDITPQQTLIFHYINEILVKSTTQTLITVNSYTSARIDAEGNLQIGGIVNDGEAMTFSYSSSKSIGNNELGNLPLILAVTPSSNEIVITPKLISNGISLETEAGTRIFGDDHATLHEFGHAIVNTIMTEFNGEFNGIKFDAMTKQQRSDWAIQFTNTLLQSLQSPLETGVGQHGKTRSHKSNNNEVLPLIK